MASSATPQDSSATDTTGIHDDGAATPTATMTTSTNPFFSSTAENTIPGHATTTHHANTNTNDNPLIGTATSASAVTFPPPPPSEHAASSTPPPYSDEDEQRRQERGGQGRSSSFPAELPPRPDRSSGERRQSWWGKFGNKTKDMALMAFTGYVPSKDQVNPYISSPQPLYRRRK